MVRWYAVVGRLTMSSFNPQYGVASNSDGLYRIEAMIGDECYGVLRRFGADARQQAESYAIEKEGVVILVISDHYFNAGDIDWASCFDEMTGGGDLEPALRA